MRLRYLKIRIQTSNGLYGADIPFLNGMSVIWADNSMGKSTCVKSILMALGLEAILTTNQSELPLTPVMKSLLTDEHDRKHQVIESRVFLEIENSDGKRITVERMVQGEHEKERDLITVIDGPALTSPDTKYQMHDYFLRVSGAATRERGFHHFLTRFLKWDLPTVQTFDGKDRPLYLQCVFPFIAVEQSRGWSTVQPPIPGQFRIKESYKRSVEFLMDMDAHKIALQRAGLQDERASIEIEWNSVIRRLGETASTISGKTQGVPSRPISLWSVELEPTIIVPENGKWVTFDQKLVNLQHRHQMLVEEEIPRVREITSAATDLLNSVEEDLKDKEALYSRVLQSLELERGEVQSVQNRISTLDEDIQKNRDLRTLKGMGSKFIDHVAHGICPTCSQNVQDSLIPIEDDQMVMTLEDNIKFLDDQKRTFEGVARNAERRVEARGMQCSALRVEISGMRQQVRELRQTLVSDGRLPSAAAIRERLILEQEIETLVKTREKFQSVLELLLELVERERVLALQLKQLPKEDASEIDREKIARWSKSFLEQVQQYGFKSYDVNEIKLSYDTYKPEYEGFDFPNSISASDLIRVIWALRNGMLEASREIPTNHPGLLVFDEPRQQGTKEVSFAELLKRASSAGEYEQQVIFFTSEPRDSLARNLRGLPHVYIEFPERVITRRFELRKTQE